MAGEPILDRAFVERLPAEPEPLTDSELEQLEARNDVAGLPSTRCAACSASSAASAGWRK